ncbi:MAG: hypothetical protein ACRCWB_03175 [Enterovibrio sp.]
MQPKNQHEIHHSGLLTRTQLGHLLDGYYEDKVYGSLQNAVVVLRNSSALPATQAVAAAPQNQLGVLLERIEQQTLLLEQNDASASGEDLPSLGEISQVSASLMSYENAYKSRDEVSATLAQREAKAQELTELGFNRLLSDKKNECHNAFFQANCVLTLAKSHFGRNINPAEPTACKKRTELSKDIQNAICAAKCNTGFQMQNYNWQFQFNLNFALGSKDAMTVTDPCKKQQLFSHLYATVNTMLLDAIPDNADKLFDFLVPTVSEKNNTSLLKMQLVLAALRGLDQETAATVRQILEAEILPGTTIESLLSRREGSANLREQFLLTAARFSDEEQKLAVMKFAKAMMSIIKTFIGSYAEVNDAAKRHMEQLSSEQKYKQMLDQTVLCQLNLESRIWEAANLTPDMTPVTSLLLPKRAQASAHTSCQIASTAFNYVVHDHKVVGAVGPPPEDYDSCLGMYDALLDGRFSAVHIINSDDDDSQSLLKSIFETPRGFNKPYVSSIEELGSAACTSLPTETLETIRSKEYQITLERPANAENDKGHNKRTIRVLETFLDRSDKDKDPYWKNHCALRQAFLAKAQESEVSEPLLTLSSNNYQGIDTEKIPKNAQAKQILQFFDANFELALKDPEQAFYNMREELPDAVTNSNHGLTEDNLSDFFYSEPAHSLQMIAADILWQDPQHTLASAVSALRTCVAQNVLMRPQNLERLADIEAHRNSQRPAQPPNRRFMEDFLRPGLDRVSLRQREIEAELQETIDRFKAEKALQKSAPRDLLSERDNQASSGQAAAQRDLGGPAAVAIYISDRIRGHHIEKGYNKLTKDGLLYYIVHNNDIYDPVGVIPTEPQDIVKFYEFIFEHKLPLLHLHGHYSLGFPANIFQMEMASTAHEERLTQGCGVGISNNSYIVSEQGVSSEGQSKMQIFTDQESPLSSIPRQQLHSDLDTVLQMHHHTVLLVKNGHKHRLNVLVTRAPFTPFMDRVAYFHRYREQFRKSDLTQSPVITLTNGRAYEAALQVEATDILLQDPSSTSLSVIAAMRACINPRSLGINFEETQMLVDVEKMREERRIARLGAPQSQFNYNAPEFYQEEDEPSQDDGGLL